MPAYICVVGDDAASLCEATAKQNARLTHIRLVRAATLTAWLTPLLRPLIGLTHQTYFTPPTHCTSQYLPASADALLHRPSILPRAPFLSSCA